MVLATMLATGCAIFGVDERVDSAGPEKLTVRSNGSMWLNDRPLQRRDVIIYEDGMGGERAAVRVRREPLRSDFFRDTIVVERE